MQNCGNCAKYNQTTPAIKIVDSTPLCKECYRRWRVEQKWRDSAYHPPKVTLHRDGRVTYWSVYRQVWVNKAEYIPDRELAAMDGKVRNRVMKHMEKIHDDYENC